MAEHPGLLVAVLAAGRASRFGGGKLETDCAGQPLGRYALDAAEAAGPPPGVVITGPEGCSFAQGWRCVVNPVPEAGIGSSLAVAARAAMTDGAGALLVLLADMPLVDPLFLARVAQGSAPAATRYPDGKTGVPALFGAALLPELARLKGDRGAGPLLAQQADLRLLDPPPDMLRDVDRVEDLADLAERIRAARGV